MAERKVQVSRKFPWKFEGLQLETVSRNLTLTQRKSVAWPKPTRLMDRCMGPVAARLHHGIELSPSFYRRKSPRVLAVPLTLISTETHHDNFAEARLKGSIFSRPKKIECRRRQPFKLACGVSCQRRTNGAAHPPPLHLRACCSHKSCANRTCAFCGSRLSTTLMRTTTPRSWEAPYVPSDHIHVRTLNISLTFCPTRSCPSHP